MIVFVTFSMHQKEEVPLPLSLRNQRNSLKKASSVANKEKTRKEDVLYWFYFIFEKIIFIKIYDFICVLKMISLLASKSSPLSCFLFLRKNASILQDLSSFEKKGNNFYCLSFTRKKKVTFRRYWRIDPQIFDSFLLNSQGLWLCKGGRFAATFCIF